MGILSFGHWMIVLLVVFLLFGPGRISTILGDLGEGLGSFRRELNRADEREQAGTPPDASLSAETAARQTEAE